MKKGMIFVVFALVLLLCSCEMPVSMTELLEYQKSDFSCSAALAGKTETELYIKSVGGKVIISLPRAEYMVDTEFVFSQDGAEIICKGEKVPMENTGLQRLFTVYKMMTLDCTQLWRITSEKAGGISVYKCVSDDGYTVYIDEKTRLPFRFEGDGEVLDVKRMEW